MVLQLCCCFWLKGRHFPEGFASGGVKSVLCFTSYLKTKPEIDTRRHMREQYRHGGRAEVRMDVPRERAILRREQFRQEGLGRQEDDRQCGRHGVRGFQYALSLCVEQYESSLTTE